MGETYNTPFTHTVKAVFNYIQGVAICIIKVGLGCNDPRDDILD